MMSTIKITKATKERLNKLAIANKGKSYDMLINDLATYYEEVEKKYAKSWKKYDKDRKIWDKLLNWAKSKGFK